MKIISKFKDYYDSAARYGIDEKIVYYRESSQIDIRLNLSYEVGYSILTRPLARLIVVGLAGEIYPIIKLLNCDPNIKTFYTSKNVDEYIEITKKWMHLSRALKIFDVESPIYSDIKTYFLKYNVPVFVIENNALILNSRLIDYEFNRVVDPYTAFSKIQGYIGGYLKSRENEIITIDDKHLRDAKGFDNMSFKKPPTKKWKIKK